MTVIGSQQWQQDHDQERLHLRVRDAARADWWSESRQTTRFWRLAMWDQPDCLDDAVVTHLEIRSALKRLKDERPNIWRTLMIVDVLRPFAPADCSAVPDECRRKHGIATARRLLGLTQSGVERRLRVGWEQVTAWLLEPLDPS